MAFTVVDARFMDVVLTALFYGIYVVLFGIFVSQQFRRSESFKSPAPISLIALFILCSVCFAIDIPYQYYGVAEAGSAQLDRALDITGSAIFSVVDFICQGIMIYRCWIVWNKRWVAVALPIIMALTALGGEFAVVAMLCLVSVNESRSKFPQLVPTGNAAFSISLAVNTFVTTLIVIKIWLSSREIRQTIPDMGKTYTVVTSMLVESGLFTFIVQLIWVLTFSLNRIGFLVAGTSITMIYGITPTVLAIRVRNFNKPYQVEESWLGTSLRFRVTTQGNTTSSGSESANVILADVESKPNEAGV